MKPLFLCLAFTLCLLTAPSFAEDKCWTVGDFKGIVQPGLRNSDLQGPAYTQFIRWSGLTPPPSDEIYIIEDGVKGAGSSVYLIFFQKGCAVGKGALPSEIWVRWVNSGRGS